MWWYATKEWNYVLCSLILSSSFGSAYQHGTDIQTYQQLVITEFSCTTVALSATEIGDTHTLTVLASPQQYSLIQVTYVTFRHRMAFSFWLCHIRSTLIQQVQNFDEIVWCVAFLYMPRPIISCLYISAIVSLRCLTSYCLVCNLKPCFALVVWRLDSICSKWVFFCWPTIETVLAHICVGF